MRKKFLACLTLLSTLSFMASAQLHVIGLAKNPTEQFSKKNEHSIARIEGKDPLTLPFWDDFSVSPTLDTAKWETTTGVYVNDGMAINPPSIGVVSFDGVQANGFGYNFSQVSPTDALTSCAIDFSGYSAASNIFMSFYYQFGGNGEAPEATDSIRVELLNNNGEWVSVWPAAQPLDRSGNFVQTIFSIDDPSFFHDSLQVRFQAFGRGSGIYDVWNIDYVYINTNRSPGDLYYPDRTISAPLIPQIGHYTAVPYDHFDFSLLDTTPALQLYSLDNPSDANQTIEYSLSTNLMFYKDSTLIATTSENILEQSLPSIGPQATSIRYPELPFEADDFQPADSVIIDLRLDLDANDNDPTNDYDPVKYAGIDFRTNDTLHTTFKLKDYYAYDDGTAEVAVGLNFNGTRLAYKYELVEGVSDTLIAVDMYFPLTQTEPSGKPLELTIWKRIGTNAQVLHQQQITISRNPLPNQYTRYELSTPLVVSDSIYIGYRQLTDGILGLGFDTNTSSTDKIYYYLEGQWNHELEDVSGSLMMRPVFGTPITREITGLEDADWTTVKLYPNPTSGRIHLFGTYNSFIIYNSNGRQVSYTTRLQGDETIIDLSHQPKGLYLVRVSRGQVTKTFKIILQ